MAGMLGKLKIGKKKAKKKTKKRIDWKGDSNPAKRKRKQDAIMKKLFMDG